MPSTNSNILPATTGLTLGNINQKWLGYVSNAFVDSVQSNSFNPALSGILRLAATDFIAWRNNANTADITLSKNTSDQFVFTGGGVLFTPAGLFSTVASSPTPIFNAGTTFSTTFKMTRGSNVTSSRIVGFTAGQVYTFILIQDGTGGRSFVWPAVVKNAMIISSAANS